VVMDQPILFHKPNKKVRSEKKMDNFIPQTKHTIRACSVSSKSILIRGGLREFESIENQNSSYFFQSLTIHET
jgi:hypothetical protein